MNPRLLLAVSLSSSLLHGCAASNDPSDEVEVEPEDEGREAEGAAVGVSCADRRSGTGYRSGKAFKIAIVDADGKPIELSTAAAYARMQKAAHKAGVEIRVVSGFRTYAQQKSLYDAYLAGRGNLAARPGYSNHQSGHALDLNTKGAGVYSWLSKHAAAYGFERTVPSEAWHWEYWGPAGDPCP